MLYRGANDWGRFIKITEWRAKEANHFVIMPEGEGSYCWKNFLEVTHRMGLHQMQAPVKEEVYQYSVDKPSKPHWIQPPESKVWNNVVACNIWGVTASWKMVGEIISRRFRNNHKECFVMLPTGFPENRALFTTESKEEGDMKVACGHFTVGNGVIVFQRWNPQLTKILPSNVNGSRWIRFWGIPLSAWMQATFQEIGNYCGELMEVDSGTAK